jgi:hypothetical protein
MCRSIKTLRPPYVEAVSTTEVQQAALQYVRKVAGMRRPSSANQAAFEEAVDRVASATSDLLAGLTVRGATGGRPSPP